jgi:hypothetical protein
MTASRLTDFTTFKGQTMKAFRQTVFALSTLATLAFGATLSTAAQAQTFPTKPVTLMGLTPQAACLM